MKTLWNELKTFTVNEGNELLSFIARLARENAWTVEHAEAVYGEYLKFVYLMTVCKKSITPSDAVDQVWHLHLCYSDSYWNELCGDVLGKKLHHGPTRGGAAEDRRFERQYGETLDLYREEFGQEPPADIWPPVKVRFDRADRFVRVNLKESFVISKRLVYLGVGAVVAGFVFSGCAEFLEKEIGTSPANILFLVAFGVFFAWLLWKLLKNGSGGGGGGAGGCAGGCGSNSGCGGGGCGGGGCGGG